ncbi:hypothetical protein NQ117_09505 [Paenibacillus sp. SC116]|uniref:hypothetical protein n=1 Tax=Paenibacillus sp. SC116 TaxID=2968986 RepID=UPI00215B2EA8|nr:hypothetical protein [Paenibacillus sp. SC116]MCR8843923.1 hypothetical protein [Paenibacillus sp. SC116]
MPHTFGVFSDKQKGVTFSQMQAHVVSDPATHPHHPRNAGSPNAPRVLDRINGYQNPLLGDEGYGEIARYEPIKIEALDNVVDQMIEQYMRDKSWYAKVRCREALWNMYRRIEWWVKQQSDPQRNDYHQVLQMMKDCIAKIMEKAQDQAGSHAGIELPHCPAPYKHPFSGDFFNHFDGKWTEIKLFDLADFPKMTAFPGHFRYVSSSEEQEWKLVHSIQKNEQAGTENIFKLALNDLRVGNSSKITFNWRFKQKGVIRFQYLANVASGNGLLFFINGQQVGGEWNQSTGWQTAQFFVAPGQTYKFDWLVRKQTENQFERNAVYVKSIECAERLFSLDPPAPHDLDTAGEVDLMDAWGMNSTKSYMSAEFNDHVTHNPKVIHMEFDNECDGEVSFSYRLGQAEPINTDDYTLFYDEQSIIPMDGGRGLHGSSTQALHSPEWELIGDSVTTAHGASIVYDIYVGDDCTVDLSGTIEMICPEREIDHYEPYIAATMGSLNWSSSGSASWHRSGTGMDTTFTMLDPKQGNNDLRAYISLPDDGWFTFSFQHTLRPSERFVVLIDEAIVFQSAEVYQGDQIEIPITKGSHAIVFRIDDSFTELPIYAPEYNRVFYYGVGGGTSGSNEGPYGSSVSIDRDSWLVDKSGASTMSNGSELTTSILLKPGASIQFGEFAKILPAPLDESSDKLIFEENFNEKGKITNRLSFSGNWEWEDIVGRQTPNATGDGIMKVEGKDNSTNTVTLNGIGLRNPGYVCFEYGGRFGDKEHLEFWVDGVSVWRGNQDNDYKGNRIAIPLPTGVHNFKWEYKDLGDSIHKEPGPIDNTLPDPAGEQCYPAGYEHHQMDGSSGSYTLKTGRNVKVEGKLGQYSMPLTYKDRTGAATYTNGGVIHRYVDVPSYADASFAETIYLYPPNRYSHSGLLEYDTTISYASAEGKNVYTKYPYRASLEIKGIVPGDEKSDFTSDHTEKVVYEFHTDGKIELSFKLLAFLQDETKERGRFRVYLHKNRSDPKGGVKLYDTKENVGRNRAYYKDFDKFTSADWVNSETITASHNGTAGTYYLSFGLTDIFSDSDGNGAILYHASINDLRLQVADKHGKNGDRLITPASEKVKAVIKVFDLSTNKLVWDDSYEAYDNGVTNDIRFRYNFEKGKRYNIQYILVKGNNAVGANLSGGGILAPGGSLEESWSDYCRNTNGHYYEKGSPTIPSLPGYPGKETEMPPDDSWCWLDVIKVYEKSSPLCGGSTLHVTLRDESQEHKYIPVTSSKGEKLDFKITNDTLNDKWYDIIYRFETYCPGEGAMVWGGGYQLIDCILPELSEAKVWGFELTNNKPIWMGGCYTSQMQVTVMDDQGKSYYNNTLRAADWQTFSLNELKVLPSRNYRVSITTSQAGEISTWTGREYLTQFVLREFRAHERWVFKPRPFNSVLSFYIDGILASSFNTMGGYYTVSYPVSKGNHVFTWEFKSRHDSTRYVYDAAYVDWFKLTNWICDYVMVVPYCETGAGDQCVEALIKCLLKLIKDKPQACVLGKKIWLFT